MNDSAPANAGLSPDQLQSLTDTLIAKRAELSAATDKLNAIITKRQDCSIMDAAEAAYLREEAARADGVAQQNNQTIAEIDRALAKMSTGDYGFCEVTGEPIAYARLCSVPWARLAK